MDTDNRRNRPLTVKEVAWYLRIDRRTVVRMLRDGKLNGFKVGPQWRVPVESLKEYMGIGEDND